MSNIDKLVSEMKVTIDNRSLPYYQFRDSVFVPTMHDALKIPKEQLRLDIESDVKKFGEYTAAVNLVISFNKIAETLGSKLRVQLLDLEPLQKEYVRIQKAIKQGKPTLQVTLGDLLKNKS